ncbi:MAG: TonB-dependent receptor domain-containing protein [Vicinamibacterales bacterium]
MSARTCALSLAAACFIVIDNAVFSPPTALIYKPLPDHAIRLSYNKAFRAPSLINNFLDVAIINQLDLGRRNPALAGRLYNFPIDAVGNEGLTEEAIQAFELAYTGILDQRTTLSAAVYWSKNKDLSWSS